MATIGGIIDNVIVPNWPWFALFIGSAWFLRWYSLSIRESIAGGGLRTQIDHIGVALTGVFTDARMNAKRLVSVAAFLVGGIALTAKFIGLSIPLLFSLDPATWGAYAAAIVSVLQISGSDMSVETSLLWIGGAIAIALGVRWFANWVGRSSEGG